MIELRAQHMEKLEEILGRTPKQIPIVVSRAINRSAEAARTQAARSARETYNVKYQAILKTIKIQKAYPGFLQASVRSVGSPLSLMKFKVEPNRPQPKRKTPILVSVKKGSRKPFKDGFVAQMRSGHLNVFARTTKKRFPIKDFYGPPIPKMLGNESVIRYVEEKAMDVLDTRLEHEINRMLGGNS
jgi:hypothetical protein